ncbi:SUMF1/EgtB/PvdO family nonheme iron enzyme [Gulosibacter faecalis]|uniref:Formylglycine-generating enzyme family protein n=1 Tax=Gulosibacter faecalis TaxID=272240 RepID=A0ABW5V1C4_9MICO
MHWISVPGGTFVMGSNDFYPEESPAHERMVPSFEAARAPVTNAEFARFVDETAYVTIAERPLPEGEYPDLDERDRAPGSLVFTPTSGPVDLRDWRQWWRWVPGASWRAPGGPGTDIRARFEHPVVHVAYADALAYAQWCGARLPTEAEAEYLAGGGATPEPYAWGSERDPDGVALANTWRGAFPYRNDGAFAATGTSPVGSFAANGFGAVDCIGNVWEWTSSEYRPSHRRDLLTAAPATGGCGCGCGARGEAGRTERVLKGGSHLCAPEYCLRYRPAGRSAQTEDSATSHIGFRVVRDLA